MRVVKVKTYTHDTPKRDGYYWIDERVYEIAGTDGDRPSYRDECGIWILLSDLPNCTKFCLIDKPELPDRFDYAWSFKGKDNVNKAHARQWFRLGMEAR